LSGPQPETSSDPNAAKSCATEAAKERGKVGDSQRAVRDPGQDRIDGPGGRSHRDAGIVAASFAIARSQAVADEISRIIG
jgi:hypothetical protein